MTWYMKKYSQVRYYYIGIEHGLIETIVVFISMMHWLCPSLPLGNWKL